MGQPPQVVQATFNDAYKPFSDAYVLSDDRLHLNNLSRVMEAFTAQCVLSEQPFKVVVRASEIQSEQQMFATLGHGEFGDIISSDKSDGIVQNTDTGDLYSLEWKSTGEWLGDDTMNKYLLDDQVTNHTYVCRENGYDVAGVLMFIVQFNKLPMPVLNKDGKPRKCKDHKIAQSDCWPSHLRFQRFFMNRSPEQLEQWKREAIKEANKYAFEVVKYNETKDFSAAQTPMEGLFNGECAKCYLRNFCLSDRTNYGTINTQTTIDDPNIVRSGVYDS